MDSWIDGNVLGGPLRDIFAMDMTSMNGRCGSCGHFGPMGEAHVYSQAAGLVARCMECDSVLMRLVTAPDRVFLDMHGLSFVELRTPGM